MFLFFRNVELLFFCPLLVCVHILILLLNQLLFSALCRSLSETMFTQQIKALLICGRHLSDVQYTRLLIFLWMMLPVSSDECFIKALKFYGAHLKEHKENLSKLPIPKLMFLNKSLVFSTSILVVDDYITIIIM